MLVAHLHMMTQRLFHPYHVFALQSADQSESFPVSDPEQLLTSGLALTRVCEPTPKLSHPEKKLEIVTKKLKRSKNLFYAYHISFFSFYLHSQKKDTNAVTRVVPFQKYYMHLKVPVWTF